MPTYHAASGSVAEYLFIELFSEAFGAEKAGYLYFQYHFYDIYHSIRYADFVPENGARRAAIEIDNETSRNKSLVFSSEVTRSSRTTTSIISSWVRRITPQQTPIKKFCPMSK